MKQDEQNDRMTLQPGVTHILHDQIDWIIAKIIFNLFDDHSKTLSYTNVTKVNNTSPNKRRDAMENPENVSIHPYITLSWQAPA